MVDERPVVYVGISLRVEGFAQTSSGRVVVRQGPRNDALFDSDLMAFVARRSFERFELRDTGVAIADAAPELGAELERNYEWDACSFEERLAEHQLATAGGNLTVAGALYLLDDPSERLGKTLLEILRFPNDTAD